MTKNEIKKAILFILFCLAVIFAFTKNPVLGGIVFMSGLLLLASHSLYTLRQVKINGIETMGIITGIETDVDRDEYPLIDFNTVQGEKIIGKPVNSSYFRLYKHTLNKLNIREIKVVYHKNKPSKFILPDYSSQHFTAVIFTAIFSLLGLIYCIYDYLS